jgi:hypothetical protein
VLGTPLMSTTLGRTTGGLIAAAVLSMPGWTAAQQQVPARAGWPCGARLDPSYFQVTEATGGHLLLLAPWEIGDSAALLTELGNHRDTIFRLAGSIAPGVHEFRVPIDSSVESVVFSISLQCLQTADIARPNAAPLVGGEGVTDHSNFRAERMVTVRRPEPGTWTIRVSGSGVAGVIVQARTDLGIEGVEFAASGGDSFTPVPVVGVENVVKIGISGRATDVQASLVNAGFRRIAPLMRTEGRTEDSYLSRFIPATQGFRVLVEGKNADGMPFQRVHAPLFPPTR